MGDGEHDFDVHIEEGWALEINRYVVGTRRGAM